LRDKIDFVIWTGDSARHDIDEEIPRTPSQVLGTNRWIADKFSEVFKDKQGKGLSIPVIPTLGNNDILPHNILTPGPNKWLRYYSDIWRKFIPEEQKHSFEYGGWFYVEVIPNKLAVFSLNTLYFFDRNAAVDDCSSPTEVGYKQMDWLRVQLEFMRQRGMKAILEGHVPPARTESKKLWEESCWQKYTLWLRQYRDVVTGSVFGHMNIDHFLLRDSKEIDMLSDPSVDTRKAMDDELTVQGTSDYLQEMRAEWSRIINSPPSAADRHTKGKKKHSDPWGERYQVSLVGPSVVPNYFPTLRVVEYNITGLEKTKVWADAVEQISSLLLDGEDQEEQTRLDLRGLSDVETEQKKKGHKGANKDKKKGHKKPGKGKKPKDPKFIHPNPPAKTSPPGPAYSPQTLSFTGYTQYYANLTHINNDITPDDPKEDSVTGSKESERWIDWLMKWRKGKNGDKTPKDPKPQPRDFQYQVEYNTKTDKLYRMSDLTVNSYVDLAYRMAQPARGGKGKKGKSGNNSNREAVLSVEEQDKAELREFTEALEGGDHDDESGTYSDPEDDSRNGIAAENKAQKDKDKKRKKRNKKHGDNGKKKKKHHKKKVNKVWFHFLRHAFVSTVEKKELKKMARE
jgi:endopolyphosphatase